MRNVVGCIENGNGDSYKQCSGKRWCFTFFLIDIISGE